jgi:hypothetical protein
LHRKYKRIESIQNLVRNSLNWNPFMKKNILLVSCLAIATALSVRAETIVALTAANHLLSFDSATPGTITSTVQVTGLQAGETLLGIDFRAHTRLP